TVILPGLHRATGGNDGQLLLWDEVAGADGHEHLLVAPMKAKGAPQGDFLRGAGNGEASAYDYLKKLEAERAAHEDERLLYVAATRAIRALHLVGVAVPDEQKDDGLKPPAAGTLLKLLWPGVPPGDLHRGVAQPVFAAALGAGKPPEAPVSACDPARFVPPLVRLAEVAVPEALRQIPGGPRPTANPVDLDATESGLTLEASVGTLVHRCLELVAKNGLENWSTARIGALQPAWRRWLRAQGHGEAEAESGAAEAAAAVSRTLDTATGRWLLAAHAEAAAEQAWSSRDGNATVNHVIDRTFVAEGTRWIIDYKTVRLPDSELAARAEEYRPQLERYAGLFSGDRLPLRMAIFFPLQGILVELPRN
ncbi:MAG TPA: PD-(D/E)XK nuclease family protein, partial [Azonexus sp.]|nr:PD-(D/E)XK nuclease family protein [Azonexus sp.]